MRVDTPSLDILFPAADLKSLSSSCSVAHSTMFGKFRDRITEFHYCTKQQKNNLSDSELRLWTDSMGFLGSDCDKVRWQKILKRSSLSDEHKQWRHKDGPVASARQ